MTFELRITADTVEELSRIVNRISHEPLTIVDDSKKDAPAPPAENPTEEDDRERDGNGVPFDPALHSSAKKMNNDGSWKKRRGAAPPPEGAGEGGQKKAPAPPEDNKPISDFPALMEFLKVDKELSLDQMNELAKQLDLEGIYAAAVVPETFPAIVALANA